MVGQCFAYFDQEFIQRLGLSDNRATGMAASNTEAGVQEPDLTQIVY
jgi:hypothetical protein